MIYHIQNENLQLEYHPEDLQLTVTQGKTQWRWGVVPTILLENGRKLSFAGTCCESAPCKTGITDGVRATYRGFSDGNTKYPYEVSTFLGLDVTTGDLRIEFSLSHDQPGEIHGVCYPPSFDFDAKEGEGYTLLSRRQGTLLPAGHPLEVPEGILYMLDGYMPIFAQVKKDDGYLAIYDTPYDGRYRMKNGQVQPMFAPSLGTISYKRIMLYAFRESCDMNSLAAIYRNYLKERGKLVTLQEKIIRNPKVADLIGTPVIHTAIATHISPDSFHYRPNDPKHNDHYVPFDTRAQQLRALKAKGIDKAYLHLDGWGKHGYDNLHPDLFPPHEASGGTDGMRRLQQTCTELGYLFGVHDQFRDYYYDAETFSMENAVTHIDGSHSYCSVWFGGKHSFLCSALIPEYVRRNYNTFQELGIQIDGSYLDTFSIMPLDECFHPDHRVTREQCSQYRRECFDALTARGIIPSSEEVLSCTVESQVLCHHAPFYGTQVGGASGGEMIGIPVPLLTLVYHDCIVVPWIARPQRGGMDIPDSDMGYIWALLCGGTVYCDIDESAEHIPYLQIALDLHRQVAFCQLTRHEFIDGNLRHRRSIFSDGTVVEANLDTTAFEIRYPDGRVVHSDKRLA